MGKNCCGKNCGECTYKTELNCPGCQDGPGRPGPDQCEVARCCRDKGHTFCDTCTYMASCGRLRECERMPEKRMRKQEWERERAGKMARKASVLGKWLWILFWIVVPMLVSNVMTNDYVTAWFPGLYMPGTVLNVLCLAAYSFVLWKASSENDRYRTASICCAISAGVSLLLAVVFREDLPGWTLVFTLPLCVAVLVGEYNEYMGHSEVLRDVAPELSEKWEKLWMWFIGMYLGMFGCVLLVLIFTVLGLIVFIVAAIGIAVVSILKLVYLYRTANVFREYERTEVLTGAEL